FGANFRITDVSFPPAFDQDPFMATGYMGDYDMVTADNNYFYTTWGDNRLSDAFFANQPDVRFAKIPVEGLGDAPTVSSTASGLPATPLADLSFVFRSSGTAQPGETGSAADSAGAAPLELDSHQVDQLFAAIGQQDQGWMNPASKPHAAGLDEDWLSDLLVGLEQSPDGPVRLSRQAKPHRPGLPLAFHERVQLRHPPATRA